MIPEDEEVFYMVALLRFASAGVGTDAAARAAEAEAMVAENEEVIQIARAAGIKLKRYLPYFNANPSDSEALWEEHFGPTKWAYFRRLKQQWDPHRILGPGQNIPL